ncbi:unnamed protein product [Nezara viridula]|uniref:Uncharacterized protein n=1 Tax=Nezara viridula TaxID=85310 RepID=A0A9P0HIG1_NEZVI|nr:unnamed protein product [Nezara viridula]
MICQGTQNQERDDLYAKVQ